MEENMTYEIFIRKCHPCDRFKHGANTDIWEYLKSCEYKANQAPPQKKDQKEFENTFKKVQKFLVEAFCASFKRLNEKNASENDIEQMRVLMGKVIEAINTTDLMNVIQEANEILKNNKITV